LLTGGYKIKFPVFHKLFLDGVENLGAREQVIDTLNSAIRLHSEKAARMGGSGFKAVRNLTGNFFQSLFVDIEVGVHILYVVVVFEGFQQANHLGCLLAFKLDVGVGNHGHAR